MIIMNSEMPKCPRCNPKKSNWVMYSWCGKYRCTRCEWVFGITPTTNTTVAIDQWCWFLSSNKL